ncbi:MAG: tRNA (uridine(34)/cytosine(34)/5-carboxymethylaminomethyluridine(34)-2'-O)-methyltransferase TrmL [Candidatus Melainabacteria bacterium]|nr:MAG: tRNA (uridine(34)/cytosine(34)/5-carboxymethylaminomethyluridine(34)-2'-O)-methyltransferase TrmL [Candidatus Melainabacteria bacterium]
MKKFNVVLYEPEIPQNTGNIARLCACTGANLYLVGKLGFSLSDKYTKRAGLDYWNSVNITKVNSLDELKKEGRRFFYLTTKVSKTIYDAKFTENDFLVFGPETRGLPEDLLHNDFALTIPMIEGQRSLNLSNSVSIVLYEAIRQTSFV